MGSSDRIQTYEEFYPYYLREHSHPWTRRVHVLGTTLSILSAIYFVYAACYWGLLLSLTMGYAFAWISHLFIEHNRPATFKYPWWSFVSDFRMAYQWYTGKLRPR